MPIINCVICGDPLLGNRKLTCSHVCYAYYQADELSSGERGREKARLRRCYSPKVTLPKLKFMEPFEEPPKPRRKRREGIDTNKDRGPSKRRYTK